MTVRAALAATAAFATLAALGGCERTFRDMYDQPRYKPLAASPLWSDGRASRPAVDGAVPRSEGMLAGASSGRAGIVAPAPAVPPLAAVRDELRPAAGAASAASTDSSGERRDAGTSAVREVANASKRAPPEAAFALPPVTVELLARGRERFDVFCAPCHGVAGDGDGFNARRGFPHPPSYHVDRLRTASDAHLYAVIRDGYGAMYPYARRLVPADRLAVVAYIRALQLSQHAGLDAVPADVRARLEAPR